MELQQVRQQRIDLMAQIAEMQNEVKRLRKREKQLKQRKNVCKYTASCGRTTSPRRELKNIGKFYRHCDEHRAQIAGRRK